MSRSNQDYHGQQGSLYYQPANYNQRQHYHIYRTTKQVPYRTDYGQGENCGINNVIPTPDMKQVPVIPDKPQPQGSR